MTDRNRINRTEPLGYRVSAETFRLLKALQERLGSEDGLRRVPRVEVVELAVKLLVERERVR
jgi:hypothetical protein